MTHWLWTAVNTYLLHSEHANGYQFWSSGPGPGLGQITLLVGLVSWWLHHRCDTPRCLRKGRYRTADGHHKLCRVCHPDLPDRRLSLHEILFDQDLDKARAAMERAWLETKPTLPEDQ